MKLKTNIGTKLSRFDMWHNCEVTRVKNKKNSKKIQKIQKIQKIKKNQKLTRDVEFNTVWWKLTAMTKLNYFSENEDQIERTKNLRTKLKFLDK